MLKRNLNRLIRRKSFYFSAVLLGFLTWFYTAGEMRTGDQRFLRQLSQNELALQAKVHYQKTKERTLRYLEIGKDHLPLIVFIHGAPSSASFWKGLLKDSLLLSNAKLLAVDRPGYGFSGLGKPVISVQKQAELIAQILKKKRPLHQQIILHGSSYGGTVAARLAMDYPELVDGVVLQSASTQAHAEKTYPISYPTHHWSLRWAVPAALRTANAEKLSHHLALKNMANGWERIQAAVIVLHGNQDGLIYPSNAFYSFERLTNARYRDIRFLEGRKHDLLWTKTELLKKSLLKLIEVTG